MATGSRGHGWEWAHSLWIFWAFTVFLNWLAFLYIGIRARRLSWIAWAAAYAIPSAAVIVLIDTPRWDAWPGDLAAAAFWVGAVAAPIHAFLVRRRYLVWRAGLERNPPAVETVSRPAEASTPALVQGACLAASPPAPPETAANPAPSSADPVAPLRFEGHFLLLLATNLGGLLFGGALLFLLLLVRRLFSPMVFLVMLIAIAAYLVADTVIWWRKGIRAIELDEEGMAVERGPYRRRQRIGRSQITGLDVFTKLGRHKVTILTGGTAVRIPGVTFFSGSRVSIASDAFPDKQFDLFIVCLQALYEKWAADRKTLP